MDEAILLMRWQSQEGLVRLGIFTGTGERVVPVDPALASWDAVIQSCRDTGESLSTWARRWLAGHSSLEVDPAAWIVPLDIGEVWTADVTNRLSRDARDEDMAEAQRLDARLADAVRPELLWKGLGRHAAGPFDTVGLRPDATWHVPEARLTAVLDDQGAVFGYTIAHDLTARDLEAAHPRYWPQAKIFFHSTALGPAVVLADTVDPYALTMTSEIWRHGVRLWQGRVETARLTLRFDDLVTWLGRAWPLAPWSAVMVGTGLVPPNEVALEDGDEVRSEMSPVGALTNHARRIDSSWVSVVKPSQRVVRIDPRDTVAVCLGSLSPGKSLSEYDVIVRDAIPFGHKIALIAMAPGDPVIKYGEKIGVASRAIAPGEHVHTHNVESVRGRGDLTTERSEGA
jgi:2-dehydro-3-deoxy-D-arabinonate dehydratase